MSDQQPHDLLGRYGRMYRDSLKENEPEKYRQLLEAGQLLAECRKVNQQANLLVRSVARQWENENPPPPDLSLDARAAWRAHGHRMGEEIALHELVLVPPKETPAEDEPTYPPPPSRRQKSPNEPSPQPSSPDESSPDSTTESDLKTRSDEEETRPSSRTT